MWLFKCTTKNPHCGKKASDTSKSTKTEKKKKRQIQRRLDSHFARILEVNSSYNKRKKKYFDFHRFFPTERVASPSVARKQQTFFSDDAKVLNVAIRQKPLPSVSRGKRSSVKRHHFCTEKRAGKKKQNKEGKSLRANCLTPSVDAMYVNVSFRLKIRATRRFLPRHVVRARRFEAECPRKRTRMSNTFVVSSLYPHRQQKKPHGTLPRCLWSAVRPKFGLGQKKCSAALQS